MHTTSVVITKQLPALLGSWCLLGSGQNVFRRECMLASITCINDVKETIYFFTFIPFWGLRPWLVGPFLPTSGQCIQTGLNCLLHGGQPAGRKVEGMGYHSSPWTSPLMTTVCPTSPQLSVSATHHQQCHAVQAQAFITCTWGEHWRSSI